jgi:hypothetical protein
MLTGKPRLMYSPLTLIFFYILRLRADTISLYVPKSKIYDNHFEALFHLFTRKWPSDIGAYQLPLTLKRKKKFKVKGG